MEHDLSNPGGYPTRIFQKFQEAIASFVAAGVPGVIVDLRGNYGGSDKLAADMCGFFTAAPSFYEYQEYYDKRTGTIPAVSPSTNTVPSHSSTTSPSTRRRPISAGPWWSWSIPAR